MKRIWIAATAATLMLYGCGEELLVKLSQAVTPPSVTEAKAELAAALDALDVLGDFSDFAPVSLKTTAGRRFAAMGVRLGQKLAVQQEVSLPGLSVDGNNVTIDCELGGSLTISGDGTAMTGSSGSSTVTLKASQCRESNGDGTTTLSDGTVKIRVESSGDPTGSNYELRMTMTIRGTFQDFAADDSLLSSEIADLEIVWDGKIDTTALEDATSALDSTDVTDADLAEFEDSLGMALQYRLAINGGLELQDSSEPCANGVYAFDTVEDLLFDLSGSACGYSDGILKINGVRYAFGASEVTISGPGYEEVVSCADLYADDICKSPSATTETP